MLICRSAPGSKFGTPMSHLSSDGQGFSATPQILDDVFIPSNKEFTMMTGQKCKDGSCGFVRPGNVAYRKH